MFNLDFFNKLEFKIFNIVTAGYIFHACEVLKEDAGMLYIQYEDFEDEDDNEKSPRVQNAYIDINMIIAVNTF